MSECVTYTNTHTHVLPSVHYHTYLHKVSRAPVLTPLCFLDADAVTLNLDSCEVVLGAIPKDMELSDDAGDPVSYS